MDGYVMLKPGWNQQVSNNELYIPKVWQKVMHILSLNGISIKLGVLTKITEDQLKVIYPLYVGLPTFTYLVEFYSRYLCLVLLVKANPDKPDCFRHLLSLKKDYKYYGGCYTESLRELRRVRKTPNLTCLAQKLKNGHQIKTNYGRDLTLALVSVIYGRGAVVHTPSTKADNDNDLKAILGSHYNALMTLFKEEKRGLFPDIYYLNPTNGSMHTILTLNDETEFGRKHFIEPYFYYSIMREWRGLYYSGVITDKPSDSLNIHDEYEGYLYRGVNGGVLFQN